MARIRNIKPDFFTDSDLADLSPLHRLFFIGLWCQADRDGLLKDRPRELKIKCIPFDDADSDAMLWNLAEAGFIVRFRSGGETLIEVLDFAEHQRFHKDEKPRGLPSSQSDDAVVLGKPKHFDHAFAPPQHHFEVGPKALKLEAGSLKLEAGSLKTESGSLKTESGVADPPSGDGPTVQKRPSEPKPKQKPKKEESVHPLQGIWNAHRSEQMPEWRETGKTREIHANARIHGRPDHAQWIAIVKQIAASAFCGGSNDRGWVAGPDWFLRPDTATKVLEGTYDNRATARAVRIDPRAPTPAESIDWSRESDGVKNAG